MTSMRLRVIVLAFGIYLALDFANPMMAGAFSFDAGDSVEGVHATGVRGIHLLEQPSLAPAPVALMAAAPVALPVRPAAPDFRSLVRLVPRRLPPATRDAASLCEDH